jgi:cytosine deaminase
VVLSQATLAQGDRVDVRLEDRRVGAVLPAGALSETTSEEVVDLDGYLLLPAPAEPHAHLDKALSAEQLAVRASDLDAAIDAWHTYRRTLGAEDIARRAEAAARMARSRGVTALRTHVDVGEGIELRAAEALLDVRDRLRSTMEIQVVALSYPLAGAAGAENRALLRAALELGVDVVGGAPHIDPDPVRHLEVCLGLATEFGRPVDLHMDEHLGASVDLKHLIGLMAEGFAQPVTASHCTSLGMRAVELQRRVAGDAARAGISVVTCPATNLHLLARDIRTATPRGVAPIATLMEAGVLVAGGGDNVQDVFHPLGCGDPLQTAALLVLAGQLDLPTAYRLVSEDARAVMGLEANAVAPGATADLLAVRGGSLREVLATTTEDRLVIRAGDLAERTSVVGAHPTPSPTGGVDAAVG